MIACQRTTHVIANQSPGHSGNQLRTGRGGHWPPAFCKFLVLLERNGERPYPALRATFTLWSNCHWQLLDFNSLRGAPPSQGKAWKTDCDRRESLERATPVCGSSQRHAFFASALKTERYRAVPNSQSNTDQPAHALNAASCRYSAFRFSTSSATFRERMTLYLS